MPGPSGDIQLCLGIHGQMVFVDRGTRTVAVKLSSWPTEQDHVYLLDTIRAFTAAGRHLAGLGGGRKDRPDPPARTQRYRRGTRPRPGVTAEPRGQPSNPWYCITCLILV